MNDDVHVTPVQRLVDALLDQADAEQPGIGYTITLAPENSLLLPVQATELPRSESEADGPFRGHIYRGCMVWDEPVLEYLVIVAPVVGRAPETGRSPTYFGDLRDGTIGTEPPLIGEE